MVAPDPQRQEPRPSNRVALRGGSRPGRQRTWTPHTSACQRGLPRRPTKRTASRGRLSRPARARARRFPTTRMHTARPPAARRTALPRSSGGDGAATPEFSRVRDALPKRSCVPVRWSPPSPPSVADGWPGRSEADALRFERRRTREASARVPTPRTASTTAAGRSCRGGRPIEVAGASRWSDARLRRVRRSGRRTGPLRHLRQRLAARGGVLRRRCEGRRRSPDRDRPARLRAVDLPAWPPAPRLGRRRRRHAGRAGARSRPPARPLGRRSPRSGRLPRTPRRRRSRRGRERRGASGRAGDVRGHVAPDPRAVRPGAVGAVAVAESRAAGHERPRSRRHTSGRSSTTANAFWPT